jgi:hypothetical protein
MKIIIEYAKHGVAISDFTAAKTLGELKKRAKQEGPDYTMVVSTSLIIHMTRLAVAKKEFALGTVFFKFNGQILPIDATGRLETWP